MAQKKINDDTLLQLIRDGNSPAGAARFLSAASCGNVRQEKTKLDIDFNLLAKGENPDVAGVGNENDTNMLIRVPAHSNATQGRDNPSIPQFSIFLPLLVAVLHGQIPDDSLNNEFPNWGIRGL